jgi:hypothetical protein
MVETEGERTTLTVQLLVHVLLQIWRLARLAHDERDAKLSSSKHLIKTAVVSQRM